MDLIDWGSKPQPSSKYWWGFKLLWIASTLTHRQGSVLRQYSIRREVVGLDYHSFTSLHRAPLGPLWKGQRCPLWITVLFLRSAICSGFQPITRSVLSLCLLSLATAVWWLRLKYFNWRTTLLSLLCFSWKYAGQEGMDGSGRGPVSWRSLTLPHQALCCFPSYLLHHRSRPTQHTSQQHVGWYPSVFITLVLELLGVTAFLGSFDHKRSSFWWSWHLQQEFRNAE